LLYLLSGCASYSATSLKSLSSECIESGSQEGGIQIAAKAFDKAACKKYLDRDVLSTGYVPVQLYIQNETDKKYSFALNRISLVIARPEDVADKVHTSTVGRAAGYGAAAVFTCGLFAIPAVIDGVKSANANTALDNDFSAKAANDQTLMPYSHFNKIIFVPVNEYQPQFTVVLIDQKTGEKTTLEVYAS
jgi:hypothetical protein